MKVDQEGAKTNKHFSRSNDEASENEKSEKKKKSIKSDWSNWMVRARNAKSQLMEECCAAAAAAAAYLLIPFGCTMWNGMENDRRPSFITHKAGDSWKSASRLYSTFFSPPLFDPTFWFFIYISCPSSTFPSRPFCIDTWIRMRAPSIEAQLRVGQMPVSLSLCVTI